MAGPASTPPLEQLRELLGDLGTGGLLITDSLESDEHGESRPDMPVAFRTLVQIDGDICTSIRASALDDPEFADALARHLAHVDRALRERTRTLRGWTTAPTVVMGAAWFVFVGGAGWQLEDLLWQAVTVSFAALGLIVVPKLGPRLVNWLIRRMMEAEVLRRSP